MSRPNLLSTLIFPLFAMACGSPNDGGDGAHTGYEEAKNPSTSGGIPGDSIGLPFGTPEGYARALATSGSTFGEERYEATFEPEGPSAIPLTPGPDPVAPTCTRERATLTATCSCEIDLPALTSGPLDPRLVNTVGYSAETGRNETLLYNPTCRGGAGFRYDHVTCPTKIVLCGGTCKEVVDEGGGALDLVVGCPSRSVAP